MSDGGPVSSAELAGSVGPLVGDGPASGGPAGDGSASGGSQSVAGALREAAAGIAQAGSASPRLDAELLLAHVLGVGREALYREPERRLRAGEAARYAELVARRLQREPVAYIVGHKAFRTIDVLVDERTIVPRPDTETLVDVALDALWPGVDRAPRALDLGTGSGAVALALCAEHPSVQVVGSDIDERALQLARGNAVRLGLADRVVFVRSDLFDGLPGGARFHVIVSNPPYVREDELPQLQEEIRRWEPREALVSGPEGLEVYRRLIPGALAFLEPGGLLAVEIHEGRADDIRELFRATRRYTEVRVHEDLSGAPRVVSGRERV